MTPASSTHQHRTVLQITILSAIFSVCLLNAAAAHGITEEHYRSYSIIIHASADAAASGDLLRFQDLRRDAQSFLTTHPELAIEIRDIESDKARIASHCPSCTQDITLTQLKRYSNSTMLLSALYDHTTAFSNHRSLRRFGINASARNINPEIIKRSKSRAALQEAQARRMQDHIYSLAQSLCDTCPGKEATQREIATASIQAAKILLNATKYRVAADSRLTEEESRSITLSSTEASQQLDRIRPMELAIPVLLHDTLESLTTSKDIITLAHRRIAHEQAGSRLVFLIGELRRKSQDPLIAIHALDDANTERLIDDISVTLHQAITTYEHGEDHLERHNYQLAEESTSKLDKTLDHITTLIEMTP